MNRSKMALLVVNGLLLASLGTCGSIYLPRTEKVNITGTEVKRLDGAPAATASDMRYIQTQTVPEKRAEVFRNEDTRFGWPPYFKFDAVDLAGEAARIAKNEPDAVVLVTYYGYRSNVLGMQPNAVGLRVVDKDYQHFPLAGVVIAVVVLALLAFVDFKLWRWLGKRAQAS